MDHDNDQDMHSYEDNDEEQLEEELSHEEEPFQVIGTVKKVKLKHAKTVLPNWVLNPIVFDCEITSDHDLLVDNYSHIIGQSIVNKLKANGIHSFFPVQKHLIPYLIQSFNHSNLLRPRDVCVSSPTGSGKTLAFVIPVIQSLLQRIRTEIRVLIVLPVSDLAIQVFQVVEKYCQGTTLRPGLAVGHKSFAEEQRALVKEIPNSKGQKAYHSLIDILVATPGRLVDLIQRTPGFSLKNLSILILDEADRMMNESQFNWLEEIEKSIFGSDLSNKYPCCCFIDKPSSSKRYSYDYDCCCPIANDAFVRPVQKILFSATLSNDIEKLQSISLFKPILFKASSNKLPSSTNNETAFVFPNELKEYMIITKTDRKPLILWYLIEILKYRKVLCFTGSLENTHRLFILLSQLPDIVVAEYSSRLQGRKRNKMLSRFLNGKIDIIVCSDIFARGLDIEGINYVICYDPPTQVTTYVHRIGRTARAGKEGTAITLLSPEQLGHFNSIIRRAHKHNKNNNKNKEKFVEKMVIKKNALKPLKDKYKDALAKLAKEMSLEKKKLKFKRKTPLRVKKKVKKA